MVIDVSFLYGKNLKYGINYPRVIKQVVTGTGVGKQISGRSIVLLGPVSAGRQGVSAANE